MTLPPEIFKAYDIRGVVGKTLTPPIVRAIGQSAGLARARARPRYAWSSVATAACRVRSSPAAVADGIRASGANVIDVGMVTTPMTLFRRASSRHAVERDGDGQPQSARLQRPQDGRSTATRCPATTSRISAHAIEAGVSRTGAGRVSDDRHRGRVRRPRRRAMCGSRGR